MENIYYLINSNKTILFAHRSLEKVESRKSKGTKVLKYPMTDIPKYINEVCKLALITLDKKTPARKRMWSSLNKDSILISAVQEKTPEAAAQLVIKDTLALTTDFDYYKSAVAGTASSILLNYYTKYNLRALGAIMNDSIDESFTQKLGIREAVDLVLSETMWWDGTDLLLEDMGVKLPYQVNV